MKNHSITGQVKEKSRQAFINIGNKAAGNTAGDESKRTNADIAPFSWVMMWAYETPKPKRRNK